MSSRSEWSDPLRRHVFANDVARRIEELSARRDNWHWAQQLGCDWGLIGLVALLSHLAWIHLPLSFAALVYAVAAIVIGARQRALADILHQASHGSLCANKQLNKLAGKLAGYPILQSFSGYYRSHVVDHHAHLGHPTRDPDMAGLMDAAPELFDLDNLSAGAVHCYVMSIFGLRHAVTYVAYLVRHRMLPDHETLDERVTRLATLAVLLATSTWAFGLGSVLAYWLIPLVTTHAWCGAFAELLEHYPMYATSPRVDILLTRNRICGTVLGWFATVHHDGYHLIHHLFPTMPNWHFAEAHLICMADPVYRQAHERWHGGADASAPQTLEDLVASVTNIPQ